MLSLVCRPTGHRGILNRKIWNEEGEDAQEEGIRYIISVETEAKEQGQECSANVFMVDAQKMFRKTSVLEAKAARIYVL